MSTQASTIYDALVTKLQTLFPEKKQIFNPYDLEQNNELFLRDGFGIGFGAFEELPMTGCCYGIRHDFTIPLTKKFYALEHDEETRMGFEKALVEDCNALIKNIAQDPQLGGAASRCVLKGGTGIQQIFGETQAFVAVTLTFTADFKENF